MEVMEQKMPAANQHLFTVLTPTFNRAHTLERVFCSLRRQTCRDFEWIIVDDGSMDDTQSLVKTFIQVAPFPIKYFSKPNGGKHSALNCGFTKASGELVLVFDSDDWCVSYALERFKELWQGLEPGRRSAYSGISVLKVDQKGQTVGDGYPESPRLKNYIDRYNRRIRGDKWELIRRELCLEYLYPEITGERYIAPSLPWLKLAEKYDTLFSNQKLSVIEYQPDGISSNNIRHRASSPKGTCLVYQLLFTISRSWRLKVKSVINYYRFVFHGGPFANLGAFAVIGIPAGFVYYLIDRYSLVRNSKPGRIPGFNLPKARAKVFPPR